MDKLLKETLECIALENEEYDKSYDLVGQIVESCGEDGLTNRLYSEIDSTVPWKVVADLYSILIWSTSDNGAAISRETEKWIIECSDERKISIALHLDTYPFLDLKEMVDQLNAVAEKFPRLKDKCNYLITSRIESNA
ncbi:hypothetical protein [Microbulbifer guangxiensis]|uniref:hypothetical protein n=1 Tax=Microbulbifer guangxiensis TaxID=2904249 RepID=UPI001F27DDED|nr:hypothetical protein [Microbulbifer guangxiensis]